MEDYRKNGSLQKQTSVCYLPTISATQQDNSKQIINLQNTLKLCRAGKRKDHFINFDLKTDDDLNIKNCKSPRTNLIIPLLHYKQNKFGPLKEKSLLKKRFLLKSRVNNPIIPCFADYDTSNLCDMKYQKQKKFIIANGQRITIFEDKQK